MNKAMFSKVILWSKISNSGSLKDQFTAELLLRMHSAFYVADSHVALCREEADRLMIIVSGTVRFRERFNTAEFAHFLWVGLYSGPRPLWLLARQKADTDTDTDACRADSLAGRLRKLCES